MGLRIQTNIASVNAQRNLRMNGDMSERAMERLGSGYRINKSMDDVAGLAISETMKGQLRGLGQAERNAQDGISFVQVAESGLNETANILNRVRELATQAASDTIGDVERGFVDIEVQQLVTELNRIANTTEYSGSRLLDGSGETLDFHVGFRGDPDNNVISYDAGMANAQAGALGVEGVAVQSKEDARGTLDVIEEAISKVASMRAGFGAIQSRMSSTINNIAVYREALSAANSRIRDADLAAESANLAKGTILQQAGVAVLTQANANNAQALKLL